MQMEPLCSSIAEVIRFANDLLQEFLLTHAQSYGREERDKLFSEQMVLLISHLSRISIDANKLRTQLRARENGAVRCVQELRDVVKVQQEELRNARKRPVMASVSVSADFVSTEKENLKKELSDLQFEVAELKKIGATTQQRVKHLAADNDGLRARLEKSLLLLRAQHAILEHRSKRAPNTSDSLQDEGPLSFRSSTLQYSYVEVDGAAAREEEAAEEKAAVDASANPRMRVGLPPPYPQRQHPSEPPTEEESDDSFEVLSETDLNSDHSDGEDEESCDEGFQQEGEEEYEEEEEASPVSNLVYSPTHRITKSRYDDSADISHVSEETTSASSPSPPLSPCERPMFGSPAEDALCVPPSADLPSRGTPPGCLPGDTAESSQSPSDNDASRLEGKVDDSFELVRAFYSVGLLDQCGGFM